MISKIPSFKAASLKYGNNGQNVHFKDEGNKAPIAQVHFVLSNTSSLLYVENGERRPCVGIEEKGRDKRIIAGFDISNNRTSKQYLMFICGFGS